MCRLQTGTTPTFKAGLRHADHIDSTASLAVFRPAAK